VTRTTDAPGVTRRHSLRWAGSLGLAAAGLGHARPARAAWPADRAVRIVVGNSPGGPSDTMARFLADGLKAQLGGSFIVENRTGGGGVVAITGTSRAEPDGYTLYLSTSGWVIAPALQANPGYDPVNDLVPVVELGASPTVFVVRSDLGVRTLGEMIALARKDQDRFSIAVPPAVSALSMAAAYLKVKEGLDRVAIVPHPGGGQAIQSLLSGTVQLCSSSLAPALPLVQEGTLRALAILSDERWPDLPDVPTAAEAGLKDANFETYTALMAPPKTPPEILGRLEHASLAMLRDPKVAARIRASGFTISGRSGEAHRARIRRELAFFKTIADQAQIKLP
jgi:tripartite-type tricarboxylate transporter receptor subunit TctC